MPGPNLAVLGWVGPQGQFYRGKRVFFLWVPHFKLETFGVFLKGKNQRGFTKLKPRGRVPFLEKKGGGRIYFNPLFKIGVPPQIFGAKARERDFYFLGGKRKRWYRNPWIPERKGPGDTFWGIFFHFFQKGGVLPKVFSHR